MLWKIIIDDENTNTYVCMYTISFLLLDFWIDILFLFNSCSNNQIFFSTHSLIDAIRSPVELNEGTPNTNNSQAPPAPEADTSNSQGISNVIYEDVAEQKLTQIKTTS